ncbi:sulfite exporter TauE/SafE family protein [Flavobacterium sp. I-SCBP12n]|uniref:Probable membrane transporter protein n=3 Tax=Flavobacteriaceae TaxID=49546 RepID=A0A9X1XQI3_9FLAO|nr:MULTISPECIES: sulfite exporter TauE/SafE family protein [Flavobacterium]MBP4141751.1 sulfite exporter TauE/SafE family protein [Flavobacterium flabelliforme]MCK8141209.1 sulfite exporter TauE/SafE family protein [Flavobacterium pygoscelis]
MTMQTIVLLMCIGLAAGILSGLIGIGGGIIMVPLLLLMGFTQQQAQGTSLAALLPPVTMLAVINYHKAGYIDWRFAIIISIVFVVGGYFGSKLAINIDQKILKKVFAVTLLFIGGFLLFDKS